MGWLLKMLQVIPMVPGVVQAIEHIHGDAKAGADKKQLALESLGLGADVAATIAPGEAAAIGNVTEFVGNIIDSTVSLFNKNGWAHKPAAPPAPTA